MNITGLDTLLFEVADVEACCAQLHLYGLCEVACAGGGRRFEAQDGSGVVVRAGAGLLCETVFRVADLASLDALADELSRDREVVRSAGAIHTLDDAGLAIGFRVARRRWCSLHDGAPLSLSHVGCLVPDARMAERFYVERLNFRPLERGGEAAVYLSPPGGGGQHALFLHQGPAALRGLDHFTFQVACGEQLMQAGVPFAMLADVERPAGVTLH